MKVTDESLCIENPPKIMPLGCAGGCQISLTEVVLTSGKRMPTGGPGTITHKICRMTDQARVLYVAYI